MYIYTRSACRPTIITFCLTVCKKECLSPPVSILDLVHDFIIFIHFDTLNASCAPNAIFFIKHLHFMSSCNYNEI